MFFFFSDSKIKVPDGRQQSVITGYFASAGVLSSSPQKGNTVKTEPGLNDHGILKEEEEAQPVAGDPMEGITEDMFVDDEEFETDMCSIKKAENEQERTGAGCSTWGSPPLPSSFINRHVKKWEDDDNEEYDVQSLPDAHYGLLGLNRPLLEPQGHIQDLPEELMSVIFARLPADDLYRHVSLVCQRWRDIVMDSQVHSFTSYVKLRTFIAQLLSDFGLDYPFCFSFCHGRSCTTDTRGGRRWQCSS